MTPSRRLYAFFGTDEALVKDAARQLALKLAPQDDEFGMEIVSGGADNSDLAVRIVGQTIEAIQTLPLFGGEKLVWLQGATFLGDSVTGRAESTLSAVETLVELLEVGLPPDVTVILSASEVDKRRTFFKRISKIAVVKTFDKVDTTKAGWETQVMSYVAGKAKSLQLTFEGRALERLVMMVGADSRVLDSELNKLSLYVGDRPATDEDVSRLVSASHTGIIFEIGEAIGRKDLSRALHLIDQQLHHGAKPISILYAAIIPEVRQLLHARDLMERHRIKAGRNYKTFENAVKALPSAETAHLPKKKDGTLSVYGLFLRAQVSDSFSAGELTQALEACLEASLRLVTTSLDAHLVLNQLVTRILSVKAR